MVALRHDLRRHQLASVQRSQHLLGHRPGQRDAIREILVAVRVEVKGLAAADGTLAAAKAGMEIMVNGQSALDATVHAVRCLESDAQIRYRQNSIMRFRGGHRRARI